MRFTKSKTRRLFKIGPSFELATAANGHLILSWPDASADFFAVFCFWLRLKYKLRIELLVSYLQSRPLWFPREPTHFHDAETITSEVLLELLRLEAEELSEGPFVPWVLEVDGKRRLPAFSSQKRMAVFSGEMSKRLGKVFAIGGAEVLLKVL